MNKRILIQILLFTTLCSCVKDNEFEFALIQTGEVTDIDGSGATFHARISDTSFDDVLEYGFIWNISGDSISGIYEKCFFSGSPSVGVISKRVSTTLLDGETYDVKSFIRNRLHTTYGKTVTFTSLGSSAPIIEDFYPKKGNLSDTLTIIGKNFSYNIEKNIVKFDKFLSEIIKLSQDTLVVIVPKELDVEKSDLSVSILNNKSKASESFQLVAPAINDITPIEGVFGSIVQLSGVNFLSNRNSLRVRFGTYDAEFISVVDDLIHVKVPLRLNNKENKITVEMNNLSVEAEGFFTLTLPKINDFHPQISTFGAEIELTGDLFSTGEEYLKVFVDKYEAKTTKLTENKITFTVPDSVSKRVNSVKIDINGVEVFADSELTMANFEIDVFSPQKIVTGESFIIIGKNFSPIRENNKISIGDIQGEVLDASVNSLTVRLPLQDKENYQDRESNVSVEVLGDIKHFKKPLIINDKWFRLEDYLGINTEKAICFVGDNVAYVGLNGTKELWQFNPDKNEWKQLADFPGIVRVDGAGFYMDGNIYFGTGFSNNKNLNDFWQYNILSNSWSRKNNFAGSERTEATGFSINDRGYITSGHYSQPAIYHHPNEDCWEYNPVSDSWKEIESYGDLEWGSVDGLAGGTAAVIDGVGYFGLGWSYSNSDSDSRRVFMFNPSSETKWKRIANFPEIRGYIRPISFSLNGVPYFKTTGSDFYKYEKASNRWSKFTDMILSDYREGIGFSISGKAYVGLGNSKAIWEYDPNR